LNAAPEPNSSAARHSSQKSCSSIASAARSAPQPLLAAPSMNPARRPMRRMTSGASPAVSAAATTDSDTGKVAQEARGARPPATMPPSSTSTIRPVPTSACAQVSSQTVLKRGPRWSVPWRVPAACRQPLLRASGTAG
jgi:hypothetical protein